MARLFARVGPRCGPPTRVYEVEGPDRGAPSPLSLPGRFSGWSRSVSLWELFDRKRRGRTNSRFFKQRYALYRISRLGQARPLYIGMARNGVFQRVCAHYFGNRSRTAAQRGLCSNTDGFAPQLHRLISRQPLRATRVRMGYIVGVPPEAIDMKLLHAYELYLQYLERPMIYNPNAWTFDDFEELRSQSRRPGERCICRSGQ